MLPKSVRLAGGLLLLLFLGTAADDGKSIGFIHQCGHDFRGEVFVKNERQITIKGVNYDGKGPASWFHGQLKGATQVNTVDKFITLPFPDASCDRLEFGKTYSKADLSLTLPVSIKEFESIGVVCYRYCINFGHIVIPADLDVPPAPADLPVTPKCPRPEYPPCPAEKVKDKDIKSKCPAGPA